MLLSSFALAANITISGEDPTINAQLDIHLGAKDGDDIRWFNTGNEYTITKTSHGYNSAETNQCTGSSLGVGEGVTLNVIGPSDGHGLVLASGFDFVQSGGTINATGNGGSIGGGGGIVLNGNFTQNGSGVINAIGTGGTGSTTAGNGVFIYDGAFIQNGDGIVNAIGNGGTVAGYGIHIARNFVQNGNGIVKATGNSETASGYGIQIYRGGFTQSENGTLYLMPGSGVSVYVSSTGSAISDLQGTLRPGVDFISGYHGLFNSYKAVTIGASAQLVPYLVNSLELAKGDTHSAFTFLHDDKGTLGSGNEFAAPKPTITMSYATDIIDSGKNYTLEITRNKYVSEVVTGDAKKLAIWMEKNSNILLNNAGSDNIYGRLLENYSSADMSYTAKEAAENLTAEAVVPQSATARLNVINENLLDIASSTLANRLTVHSNKTELMPLDNDAHNSIWVTPLGTVMNIYPDEKLNRAIYGGAGLNVGLAGFLSNNSSYGLAITYLDGYYNDTDFDKFDTSFLSGSLGYRMNPGFDKIWLEGLLSYAKNSMDAYGIFDKTKSNSYRASAKAGMDIAAGSWRFTPAIGLDYTYFDFGKLMMDDSLVTISIKDTDYLRPLAEVETVYNAKNLTSFGLKLGYNYEAFGHGIEHILDIVDNNDLITLSNTVERPSRHNGYLAFNVNHAISNVLSFNGEYNLRLNDQMTTNALKLNFKWLY